MKVGIVGAGIAGLAAARALRGRAEAWLIEADDRLGGHAHTVQVDGEDGPLGVDTGFIVFNRETYPRFSAMLDELGVETLEADMSFSVSNPLRGIEWASHGWAGIFAQPRNLLRPSFLGMLREISRFQKEARQLLRKPGEKATLGEYVAGRGYSREFIEDYLVPMGAAIWSAEPGGVLGFDASSFAEFFANHGLLDRPPSVRWRTVRGGSRRYVESLTSRLGARVLLRWPVRQVTRRGEGVIVGGPRGTLHFDRVVLAVHSDQALSMLADASESEARLLAAIRYQPNDVVLHSDPSVMPRNRRAWASWNYRSSSGTKGRVQVTYHMNRLQRIAGTTPWLVTLNGGDRIDPVRVHGRWLYEHPILDRTAVEARRKLTRIQGRGGIYFAGAWCGHGFHEDGMRSGEEAVESLLREG